MPSGYLLPCRCGKQTIVFRSQAGEQVACECGEKLDVPTLRGFSELATSDQKVAANRISSERPKWNPMLGIPAAIFFAFALISFGLLANASFWRYQVDTKFKVEDEIRKGEEALDAMQPAEILVLHRNFRELGLGEKSAPEFYARILYAKDIESNMMFYAEVFGGCLLIGAVLTFLSRRK